MGALRLWTVLGVVALLLGVVLSAAVGVAVSGPQYAARLIGACAVVLALPVAAEALVYRRRLVPRFGAALVLSLAGNLAVLPIGALPALMDGWLGLAALLAVGLCVKAGIVAHLAHRMGADRDLAAGLAAIAHLVTWPLALALLEYVAVPIAYSAWAGPVGR
jgi:hypothetical protein